MASGWSGVVAFCGLLMRLVAQNRFVVGDVVSGNIWKCRGRSVKSLRIRTQPQAFQCSFYRKKKKR